VILAVTGAPWGSCSARAGRPHLAVRRVADRHLPAAVFLAFGFSAAGRRLFGSTRRAKASRMDPIRRSGTNKASLLRTGNRSVIVREAASFRSTDGGRSPDLVTVLSGAAGRRP